MLVCSHWNFCTVRFCRLACVAMHLSLEASLLKNKRSQVRGLVAPCAEKMEWTTPLPAFEAPFIFVNGSTGPLSWLNQLSLSPWEWFTDDATFSLLLYELREYHCQVYYCFKWSFFTIWNSPSRIVNCRDKYPRHCRALTGRVLLWQAITFYFLMYTIMHGQVIDIR